MCDLKAGEGNAVTEGDMTEVNVTGIVEMIHVYEYRYHSTGEHFPPYLVAIIFLDSRYLYN